VRRAWSPPICLQLVEDIREPSNSATFSAVISIYLLSELQWTVESQILQAATEMRISYLEHLVLQKGYLVENSPGWIVFASSVKNHLGSCLYPWVLGNIITWAEANMLNMFAMILSEPLVPTYAHVYQHLRNTAAIKVDRDMDHLCDKFRLLLFWDRRPPCDERSVETSFWKWIALITPKRAAQMVKSRFKENLAFSIGSNNWCISQVLAKKYMLTTVDYLDAGFMSLLQARLEEDRHLIDTFALSKSVCRALENLDMATTIERRELQLWNIRNHSAATTLFPLQCEYLQSCLQELCMGCRKVIGREYFFCKMCKYAKYCGKSCQRKNWRRHRQYCSTSRPDRPV
jgi:hypothetical protein